MKKLVVIGLTILVSLLLFGCETGTETNKPAVPELIGNDPIGTYFRADDIIRFNDGGNIIRYIVNDHKINDVTRSSLRYNPPMSYENLYKMVYGDSATLITNNSIWFSYKLFTDSEESDQKDIELKCDATEEIDLTDISISNADTNSDLIAGQPFEVTVTSNKFTSEVTLTGVLDDDNLFEEDTEYMITIILTEKEGYTFCELTKDEITGWKHDNGKRYPNKGITLTKTFTAVTP